jgi:hypothetical protein
VTTTLDEREERILIATARAGNRDKTSALKQAQIEAAIAAFPEINWRGVQGRAQRQAIDVLSTGGRVGLAIGVAGSGKSTLLMPLVRAWQDDGRSIYGIALAWRQSDDLAAAGIAAPQTRAVASFLRGVQSGKLQVDRKSVVVVDEIGLLGTRQLNDILAVQAKSGFQLVMIGDPKQMQSVEAGPVIALLRRALGEEQVPELGSSVRQKDEEERETVLMFRNGQTGEALRRKESNGTLQIVPGGYREAVLHVAALWQQRRDENLGRPGFTISVSAPTNAEAHDISLAIREHRRSRAELGADQVTIGATDGEGLRVYDLALARGDRVRLFNRANATFLDTGKVGNIGRNGTVLDIAGISDNGLTLRAASGREGLVAWTTLKDGVTGLVKLAYGDALTTNTAQGTTVTEHIHALPSGSRLVSAFGAYTSGSRHREKSFIVTSDGAERAEIVARRPLGDRRQVMPGDVMNNLTRNLARQPEKPSALDLIDRAAGLRRGTIQTVQISQHAAEARTAAMASPTTLPERFANRRLTRALEDRLPGLAEHLRRHGALMARMAKAGAALAERVATMARLRIMRREKGSEAEYWQKLTERDTSALRYSDDLRQTKGRSRRR